MRTERFHHRDLTYSAWHREASIGRFIGPVEAELLSMIDVDCALWVEYEDRTRTPLVLIETARDIGQIVKMAAVTQQLARMARLPAYVVLTQAGTTPNPASPLWADIRAFRVQRAWPAPEAGWRVLTPEGWAESLLQIRGWSLRRLQARAAANDPIFDQNTDRGI
jgi:hypothetical protein